MLAIPAFCVKIVDHIIFRIVIAIQILATKHVKILPKQAYGMVEEHYNCGYVNCMFELFLQLFSFKFFVESVV